MLIYHTGPVMLAFFTELSDILNRVVMYIDPVLLIGNFNICLDRVDDLLSRQFTDVPTAHGLLCHVTTPTHNRGGLLHVVASRHDLQSHPSTCRIIGCSDGRRHSSGHVLSTHQRCTNLDKAVFCERLLSSPICQPDTWSERDVNKLPRMYDEVTTTALNQLVPAQSVKCRHCHQIHGLTIIVRQQSIKLGDWSEQLDEPTQMTLLPSPLLLLHGPPSDVPTCFALHQERVLNDHPPDSCGGSLMWCWAVAVFRCATP